MQTENAGTCFRFQPIFLIVCDRLLACKWHPNRPAAFTLAAQLTSQPSILLSSSWHVPNDRPRLSARLFANPRILHPACRPACQPSTHVNWLRCPYSCVQRRTILTYEFSSLNHQGASALFDGSSRSLSASSHCSLTGLAQSECRSPACNKNSSKKLFRPDTVPLKTVC